jgi:hypothetical protein
MNSCLRSGTDQGDSATEVTEVTEKRQVLQMAGVLLFAAKGSGSCCPFPL